MGTNKIILLLIVLSVVISGCLSSEDEEIGTPVETVAQEELETQTETETQEELGTPQETAIPGAGEEAEAGQTEEGRQAGDIQSGGAVPTTHPVRLKDYLMIPPRLEIYTGETVIWRNYQESSVLFLTSREYLFEDQRLVYGDTFEYTFDEPGSYNFSVKGYPKMQMTITVK